MKTIITNYKIYVICNHSLSTRIIKDSTKQKCFYIQHNTNGLTTL